MSILVCYDRSCRDTDEASFVDLDDVSVVGSTTTGNGDALTVSPQSGKTMVLFLNEEAQQNLEHLKVSIVECKLGDRGVIDIRDQQIEEDPCNLETDRLYSAPSVTPVDVVNAPLCDKKCVQVDDS